MEENPSSPSSSEMKLQEFDYHLPPELIAQRPAEPRDSSRMMVVEVPTGRIIHEVFLNFPEYLRKGDLVVVNNTKVIPARLFGRRDRTGARVEVLLLRKLEPSVWEVMAKPARRVRKGETLTFEGEIKARVLEEKDEGKRIIEFSPELESKLSKVGKVPLPPYIKRPADAEDAVRYQTIFAKEEGSIAAPTAGLHFTERVIKRVRKKAEILEITLHVGEATFRPLKKEEVEENTLPEEVYYISPEASEKLKRALQEGRRVVAVGTTTVRALESAARNNFEPGYHTTSLFIYPGFEFKVISALLTNFHLPRSSLLLLVSAFAGKDLILRAYDLAVQHRYRFYSYGDCMLIIRE